MKRICKKNLCNHHGTGFFLLLSVPFYLTRFFGHAIVKVQSKWADLPVFLKHVTALYSVCLQLPGFHDPAFVSSPEKSEFLDSQISKFPDFKIPQFLSLNSSHNCRCFAFQIGKICCQNCIIRDFQFRKSLPVNSNLNSHMKRQQLVDI